MSSVAEDLIEQFADLTPEEVEAALREMPDDIKADIDRIIASDPVLWRPLPGPQTMARDTEAFITGFGGAAGGGKTDLAIGLALTEHQKTFIFRQEATQLVGIIDRVAEILGSRDGYNSRENVWRLPQSMAIKVPTPRSIVDTKYSGIRNRQLEFGSVPNPGDERKYQGRPKDLLVGDEVTNIREGAVRFLTGWIRSVNNVVRKRALFTFNPPTDAEGRWVISYFAPWLDTQYPVPAMPGELRWFASLGGKDVEVPSNAPFVLEGDRPIYEFDPKDYTNRRDLIVTPQSRTFIPSRITDNPYLANTGYMTTLQALPEPLRSQMLYGDFQAGVEDDQWQVIPTAWVEAAQARWSKPYPMPPMDSLGVDVARGGKDKTIVFRRHGMFYDEPIAREGRDTKDGPAVAGLVVGAARDLAPIHIDVIGVGASPYDFLKHINQQVVGVNVAESANTTDKSGRLRFFNLRSQLWWQMREDLDPVNNTGVMLPPVRQLLLDLTAPKWGLSGGKIKVESREDIIKRIGRSPDYGSALILARMDTPRRSDIEAVAAAQEVTQYDPYIFLR